jgi:hypothetical protein
MASATGIWPILFPPSGPSSIACAQAIERPHLPIAALHFESGCMGYNPKIDSNLHLNVSKCACKKRDRRLCRPFLPSLFPVDRCACFTWRPIAPRARSSRYRTTGPSTGVCLCCGPPDLDAEQLQDRSLAPAACCALTKKRDRSLWGTPVPSLVRVGDRVCVSLEDPSAAETRVSQRAFCGRAGGVIDPRVDV